MKAHILNEDGYRRKETAYWMSSGGNSSNMLCRDMPNPGFDAGDWIGVYDSLGYCRGYSPITILPDGNVFFNLSANGHDNGSAKTIDGYIQLSEPLDFKSGFVGFEEMFFFLHKAEDDSFYKLTGTYCDFIEWYYATFKKSAELLDKIKYTNEAKFSPLKFWKIEEFTIGENITLLIDEFLTKPLIYSNPTESVGLGKDHRVNLNLKTRNIEDLQIQLDDASQGLVYRSNVFPTCPYMFEAIPGGTGTITGKFTGYDIWTGDEIVEEFEVEVLATELPESINILWQDERLAIYEANGRMFFRTKFGIMRVSSTAHGLNTILGDYRVSRNIEGLTKDAWQPLINGIPNTHIGKVTGHYYYHPQSGPVGARKLHILPNDPKMFKEIHFEFELPALEVEEIPETELFVSTDGKVSLLEREGMVIAKSNYPFVLFKFTHNGRKTFKGYPTRTPMFTVEIAKQLGLVLESFKVRSNGQTINFEEQVTIYAPDKPEEVGGVKYVPNPLANAFIDIPELACAIDDKLAVMVNRTTEDISFSFKQPLTNTITASIKAEGRMTFPASWLTKCRTKDFTFNWSIKNSDIKGSIEFSID